MSFKKKKKKTNKQRFNSTCCLISHRWRTYSSRLSVSGKYSLFLNIVHVEEMSRRWRCKHAPGSSHVPSEKSLLLKPLVIVTPVLASSLTGHKFRVQFSRFVFCIIFTLTYGVSELTQRFSYYRCIKFNFSLKFIFINEWQDALFRGVFPPFSLASGQTIQIKRESCQSVTLRHHRKCGRPALSISLRLARDPLIILFFIIITNSWSGAWDVPSSKPWIMATNEKNPTSSVRIWSFLVDLMKLVDYGNFFNK